MSFQPTCLLSVFRYSVLLAVYMCGHASMYAQSSDSAKENESVKQERNSIMELSSGEKEDAKSCLDYIRRTGKLWGISEVAIDEAAGTVTLVDARNTGYGYRLTMYDCKNKRSLQVTLKVNQHCRLSDGHHAFMKYEIKSIKDGIVEIAVTERFDARSFGKGVTKQTENVTVKPYKDEQQSQQAVQDADLKIVSPILIINQRDPEDSFTFNGRTLIKYRTTIVLNVWNRSKQKCYFPTKAGGCCIGLNENTETLEIELEIVPDLSLVETDDRPKIPIVQAESSFDIAEIRPGEATAVNYKTTINNEMLSGAKQVVFVIKSEHYGRYSFWEGKLTSERFPLDSTPNFRIIK